jgi:hypothetical protein
MRQGGLNMKTCGVLLFVLALWATPARAQRRGSAQYGHNGPALLPDPKVTPGDAASTDAKIVCVRGYARHQRNVSPEMKRRVYALYGVRTSYETTQTGKRVRTCCEVDHLISLELGGSNDIKNLWPEPYLPKPGARQKDVVEDWLHRQVCSGKMPLAEAQRKIATDWYVVYGSIPRRD